MITNMTQSLACAATADSQASSGVESASIFLAEWFCEADSMKRLNEEHEIFLCCFRNKTLLWLCSNPYCAAPMLVALT
jgi:hypothetical protein